MQNLVNANNPRERLNIVLREGRYTQTFENRILMSTWRNRYTRTFEGRVGKPVRVQVPPSTFLFWNKNYYAKR